MENICKAFVKFQSEFKGIKPDSSNPFFKSTYISLDGILETARPILAKNGLAVKLQGMENIYLFRRNWSMKVERW